MPPRVLLLDVMGTLVHDPFYELMPAFFGMTFDELLEAKHPDAWIRYERGELDEASFLRSFFADGRAFDERGLVEAVVSEYRFLEGVERLLMDLKQAGIVMHAFSNYPDWYRRIEAKLELSRFLEWSFVSCNTGIRKPAPEAYLEAAKVLRREPAECVFVDDRESNCAAARLVGMDALQFIDAGQLRTALTRRGLLAL